jgi:hypothetical protein
MYARSTLSKFFISAFVALGGRSGGGRKSNPPVRDDATVVDLDAA